MSASSDEPLQRIHDQRLRLRQVTAHVRESVPVPYIRALSLVFDAVSIVLVAEDDDSLSIASEYADPELSPISLGAEQPWSRALGKPLLWSWSLTNQQGYRDGLQLELANNVDDASVVIQILVEASTIKLRQIERGFVSLPKKS